MRGDLIIQSNLTNMKQALCDNVAEGFFFH